MSQLKVGINGLGRIGRLVVRQGFDKIKILALNGRSSIETAAHLLKYDSVHGVWDRDIRVEQACIYIDDVAIPYFQSSHPKDIPWSQASVDCVVECTGVFKKRDDLSKHLGSSVKKVIVSAPAEGADTTLIFGINHQEDKKNPKDIVSLGSCTTNCLAPIIQVLHTEFTIEQAFFTTTHAYTKDQMILDSSHKDLRRARACATNIIPTSTGAAQSIFKIFPDLKNKLQGSAVRVPVANVSLLDIQARLKQKTLVSHLNQAFKKASSSQLKGVLSTEEKLLVSSDFLGRKESSIVDLASTAVLDDRFVKLVSWYDNEAGFSERIIDFIRFMEES